MKGYYSQLPRGYYKAPVFGPFEPPWLNIVPVAIPRTALHITCRYGHTSIAKLLIERKACINIRSYDPQYGTPHDNKAQETPLICAVIGGHVETTKLLLEKKACLKSSSDAQLVFGYAAEYGQTEVIQELIKHGIGNINGTNLGDWPVLHYASRKGHMAMVKLLLDNKANVNLQARNDQSTALHHAAENNHREIANILINQGAKIDILNDSSKKALDESVQNHHYYMTCLLLRAGNNHQDEVSRILPIAAANLSQNIVRRLLMLQPTEQAKREALRILEMDKEAPFYKDGVDNKAAYTNIVKMLSDPIKTS